MGHETRLAIVALLRETPGLGGGDIGRALDTTAAAINSDMAFLRKNGILRHEGENCNTRWFANEGMEVMPQTKGPVTARGIRYNTANICDYHRAGGKRNGTCMRCQESVNVAQKKLDHQLKRLFPVIFAK